MKPPDDAFRDAIERRVRDALASGIPPARLLDDLVGLDPVEIQGALERLGVPGHAASRDAGEAPADARLPVPHPLDYDWRFGEQTARMLLDDALGRVGPSEEVALLGTPSLLLAAERHLLAGRAHLLDRNPALAAFLGGRRFFRCDVTRDPLPPLRSRVAVADPPWYPDLLRAFVWAAHALLADGGDLLLCLPSEDARPGIDGERRDLFRWAETSGFRVVEHRPRVLIYDTPPFERNAHRARGLTSVPVEWRRGDLAGLRRESPSGAMRPTVTWTESRWDERTVRGIRWRVRPAEEGPFEVAGLGALVADDVLPSVSRRDPRRAAADVWTSGNRVFACPQPAALLAVLDALVAGEDPAEALRRRAGRALEPREREHALALARRVEDVVALERAEYGDAWHAAPPPLDPQSARRAP